MKIKTIIIQKKFKIRWSDEGYNFTVIPLIIARTKLFCQHGEDRKLLAKEKKKKEKDQKKARNYAN